MRIRLPRCTRGAIGFRDTSSPDNEAGEREDLQRNSQSICIQDRVLRWLDDTPVGAKSSHVIAWPEAYGRVLGDRGEQDSRDDQEDAVLNLGVGHAVAQAP